ncbi:MAG: hypothetical protein WCK90_04780 [archaeon]
MNSRLAVSLIFGILLMASVFAAGVGQSITTSNSILPSEFCQFMDSKMGTPVSDLALGKMETQKKASLLDCGNSKWDLSSADFTKSGKSVFVGAGLSADKALDTNSLTQVQKKELASNPTFSKEFVAEVMAARNKKVEVKVDWDTFGKGVTNGIKGPVVSVPGIKNLDLTNPKTVPDNSILTFDANGVYIDSKNGGDIDLSSVFDMGTLPSAGRVLAIKTNNRPTSVLAGKTKIDIAGGDLFGSNTNNVLDLSVDKSLGKMTWGLPGGVITTVNGEKKIGSLSSDSSLSLVSPLPSGDVFSLGNPSLNLKTKKGDIELGSLDDVMKGNSYLYVGEDGTSVFIEGDSTTLKSKVDEAVKEITLVDPKAPKDLFYTPDKLPADKEAALRKLYEDSLSNIPKTQQESYGDFAKRKALEVKSGTGSNLNDLIDIFQRDPTASAPEVATVNGGSVGVETKADGTQVATFGGSLKFYTSDSLPADKRAELKAVYDSENPAGEDEWAFTRRMSNEVKKGTGSHLNDMIPIFTYTEPPKKVEVIPTPDKVVVKEDKAAITVGPFDAMDPLVRNTLTALYPNVASTKIGSDGTVTEVPVEFVFSSPVPDSILAIKPKLSSYGELLTNSAESIAAASSAIPATAVSEAELIAGSNHLTSAQKDQLMTAMLKKQESNSQGTPLLSTVNSIINGPGADDIYKLYASSGAFCVPKDVTSVKVGRVSVNIGPATKTKDPADFIPWDYDKFKAH